MWDCQTGQCAGVITMGREVGCMISEGPWLFVGIPDAVKVWNMQTAAEMNLTGPTGQVYALAVASELLFAATQVSFHLLGYICFVLIFFWEQFFSRNF